MQPEIISCALATALFISLSLSLTHTHTDHNMYAYLQVIDNLLFCRHPQQRTVTKLLHY